MKSFLVRIVGVPRYLPKTRDSCHTKPLDSRWTVAKLSKESLASPAGSQQHLFDAAPHFSQEVLQP